MTDWNPPRGFKTIAETSAATGFTPSCLRIWETRYGWPDSIRNPHNNFRFFSPATIEELKRFAAAGSPVSELQDGAWIVTRAAITARATAVILEDFRGIVDDRLIDGARKGDRGVVAFYLASLGRMRPPERCASIRCIQEAMRQLDGAFADLLASYDVRCSE